MSATAAVRERPILFSGEMVRAILNGRKTQTRRVIKPQPYPNGWKFDGDKIHCWNDYLPPSATLLDVGSGRDRYTTSDVEGWETDCPYGAPGDRLWVRETWAVHSWRDHLPAREARKYQENGEGHCLWYRAGGGYGGCDAHQRGRWRASIHMPRWASRLTLEITEVRVQRVQEISEGDAIAEGCFDEKEHDGSLPTEVFRVLWDSLNAKRGYAWDSNPWVWALTFKRAEG